MRVSLCSHFQVSRFHLRSSEFTAVSQIKIRRTNLLFHRQQHHLVTILNLTRFAIQTKVPGGEWTTTPSKLPVNGEFSLAPSSFEIPEDGKLPHKEVTRPILPPIFFTANSLFHLQQIGRSPYFVQLGASATVH